MEAIETILSSLSSLGSRRGSRVLGILIPRGVQHLEEADLIPRRAMEVRCSFPKRIVLSGPAHSGECRQGTNACFVCGMSGHMVRDCPQNRGQAGGNAQPRPNPQSATAAEPPKRNKFYALKGREEKEKFANVAIGVL